jgi:hypothetical protein
VLGACYIARHLLVGPCWDMAIMVEATEALSRRAGCRVGNSGGDSVVKYGGGVAPFLRVGHPGVKLSTLSLFEYCGFALSASQSQYGDGI